MVRRFYADVAQDDLLGPMFNDVAQVDWSEHLPKLAAFWCRALLGHAGVRGQPVPRPPARPRATRVHAGALRALADPVPRDARARLDRPQHATRAGPRRQRRPRPQPPAARTRGLDRHRTHRPDEHRDDPTRAAALPNRRAPTSGTAAGRGAPGRVAEVHAQTRRGLLVAAAFMAAAVVTGIAGVGAGWWLPLHLFVVGGLLSAISATTQMLAVTWSAAPAPRPLVAGAQRWALAVGAVALVVGRETDRTWMFVAGGTHGGRRDARARGDPRSASGNRRSPHDSRRRSRRTWPRPSPVPPGCRSGSCSARAEPGATSRRAPRRPPRAQRVRTHRPRHRRHPALLRRDAGAQQDVTRATPTAMRVTFAALVAATAIAATGHLVERPGVVAGGLIIYGAGAARDRGDAADLRTQPPAMGRTPSGAAGGRGRLVGGHDRRAGDRHHPRDRRSSDPARPRDRRLRADPRRLARLPRPGAARRRTPTPHGRVRHHPLMALTRRRQHGRHRRARRPRPDAGR